MLHLGMDLKLTAERPSIDCSIRLGDHHLAVLPHRLSVQQSPEQTTIARVAVPMKD